VFAKGTKIMYGNTGVCEVMDYATPDLPGMPRGTKYYVLRPLFQSGTIYCPVEQPKVFMRPVMSREEAEEAGRISFAEFKKLYRQMKAEEKRKQFSPA